MSIIIIITIIIIIIIIAIEFSLGGSSPYTSTDKTNKNKIHINETIQKNSTNDTQHSNSSTHITKTPTHYVEHKRRDVLH